MKNFRKNACYALAIVFVVSCFTINANAKDSGPQRAKNIIFMVPDGMGLDYVTAARVFANGPDGAPLYLEQFPQIGYQRTHSANSEVTDSAAAASAWASGDKFSNGEISCHYDEVSGSCVDEVPTILEITKDRGKSTGLVATSQISHATPAAFGAHTSSRYCGAEIARQYVDDVLVDVVLGGGVYKTKDYCDIYPESFNVSDKRQYIIDIALDNGYTFVTDKEEMSAAVSTGNIKLLGMFEQNGPGMGKTPELFRVDDNIDYPYGEPTLAEMTVAALDILEENNQGFFLLVEGSQIDWSGHANDVDYLLGEMIGFDKAVQEVKKWLGAKKSRESQTLVIVVADHETGGFAVDGPYGDSSEPGDIIVDGWTSESHTAGDTIIWSQGPGSQNLGAALDNTDLYYIMKDVLK